jgi:AmiR/NasT family two-component response regulator
MNGNKTIVLADDDRLILSTLGEGLRGEGYQVFEAEDGDAAVALCKEKRPALALLDMRMPGLSGIEAARRLRAETDVPFLFLSAYGDAEAVQQATEEGALGYLLKPIDLPQVVPSIEAAVARAADIRGLKASEYHLNRALAQGRQTSVAVGVIMERHRLTEREAFDLLRNRARSQRRKVVDVAQELVDALNLMNLSTAGKDAAKP